MMTNFGMVEPFSWNETYFIPTGGAVLAQWEHLLTARRHGHLDSRGRFTNEYWKMFETNYVQPLSKMGVHEWKDNVKICNCSMIGSAVPANPEALQIKSRILGLNDIFDIAKHTYTLPLMSPLFMKRNGFVGEDLFQWGMKCYCNGVFSAVKLERSENVSQSDVGLEALKRAPTNTYSRSFFKRGSSAIRAIVKSEIPRQEVRWGIARFARLAAGYEGELLFKEWSERHIVSHYWATERHYPMKSDAVVAMLLQMATFNESHAFYPNLNTQNVFNDPAKLSALFKLVRNNSEHESENHDNYSVSDSKHNQNNSAPLKFKTYIDMVTHGIDSEIGRMFEIA